MVDEAQDCIWSNFCFTSAKLRSCDGGEWEGCISLRAKALAVNLEGRGDDSGHGDELVMICKVLFHLFRFTRTRNITIQ